MYGCVPGGGGSGGPGGGGGGSSSGSGGAAPQQPSVDVLVAMLKRDPEAQSVVGADGVAALARVEERHQQYRVRPTPPLSCHQRPQKPA